MIKSFSPTHPACFAMAAGSSLQLLLLVSLGFLCQATDFEWYISPTGTEDVGCGTSADTPCSSLRPILERSDQFVNDTLMLTCYLSSGATDGRDSTTLYFSGENFVPAVCLMNWVNVRVVGLGEDAIITSDGFGGEEGFFEFISCSNISIENLDFSTSNLGKAVLFFEACRDITIVESSFPVTKNSSSGVKIVNCAGTITLTGDLFYGNGFRSIVPIGVLGLDVSHGCDYDCKIPFTDPTEIYDFSNLTFFLAISRCTFQDIVDMDAPVDSYGVSRTTTSGVRLQFRDQSANNQVSVTGSTFQRIFNSGSNGVLVSFNGNTRKEVRNNTVTFDNCTFQHNHVRYGGGLSAFFYSEPSDNTLQIQNCQFFNNTADLEGGGVFVALLSSGTENAVGILNTTFEQNSARIGSGVYMINNPSWLWQRGSFDLSQLGSLAEAEIRDCVFQDNVASVSEGTVDVLRIQLYINGVR
jgi:hypothetical protein